MSKQVCVSIGVERCGRLPNLPGAVNGAKEFAAWGRDNHYDVVLVTDEGALKVTAAQVTSIISEIVEQGDTERLIIYFAGHGSQGHASSECWLLSDVESDSSEAINVGLSLLLAAKAQIAQIALIADACRSSIPYADEIAGRSLFPRREVVRRKAPLTDMFFACQRGDPAQEIVGSANIESYGIFSRCLMEALRGNVRKAVQYVAEPVPAFAVTSASLAAYLDEAVPDASSRTPGASRQDPETVAGWRSPNNIYQLLGSGEELAKTKEMFDAHPWISGQGDPTQLEEIWRSASTRHATLDGQIQREASRLYRSASQQTALVEGILLHRMRPVRVASPGRSEIVAHGEEWLVRATDRRSQPVLVLLADGRWLGASIMTGLLGEVTFGDSGIDSVFYRPLFESPTPITAGSSSVEWWTRYLTAALNLGLQPLGHQLEAASSSLLSRKRINPSLAILTAYFLARTGRIDDVVALVSAITANGRSVPFDIALLAGASFAHEGQGLTARIVLPDSNVASIFHVDGLFPLLTRTWGFLAAAGDALPRAIQSAAGGIEKSLWTLLDASYGERLADAIEGMSSEPFWGAP